MRAKVPGRLEAVRIRNGIYGSTNADGFNGAFLVSHKGGQLRIIANSAQPESAGWEHVSVSLENRAPHWDEMCLVKSLFWDDHEVVVQFHPAKADYVNYHPHCLHLWRHKDGHTTPPTNLVGPK